MDRLVFFPHPCLRAVSSPVVIDPAVLARARTMLPLMYKLKGIGLAAPQIGWNVRLFVMNTTWDPADELLIVNPEIVTSDGSAREDEGCLSLPNRRFAIARPAKIKVRGKRIAGAALRAGDLTKIQLEDFEAEETGLRARCFQHEIDHLAGILIIDRLGRA